MSGFFIFVNGDGWTTRPRHEANSDPIDSRLSRAYEFESPEKAYEYVVGEDFLKSCLLFKTPAEEELGTLADLYVYKELIDLPDFGGFAYDPYRDMSESRFERWYDDICDKVDKGEELTTEEARIYDDNYKSFAGWAGVSDNNHNLFTSRSVEDRTVFGKRGDLTDLLESKGRDRVTAAYSFLQRIDYKEFGKEVSRGKDFEKWVKLHGKPVVMPGKLETGEPEGGMSSNAAIGIAAVIGVVVLASMCA